ncbi:DUF1345 domain-containing protein [Nocardia tengchongensis]
MPIRCGARRAREHRRRRPGLPELPQPQFSEFLYFATTIGTSFAVSDVTVTTRLMRRRSSEATRGAGDGTPSSHARSVRAW